MAHAHGTLSARYGEPRSVSGETQPLVVVTETGEAILENILRIASGEPLPNMLEAPPQPASKASSAKAAPRHQGARARRTSWLRQGINRSP